MAPMSHLAESVTDESSQFRGTSIGGRPLPEIAEWVLGSRALSPLAPETTAGLAGKRVVVFGAPGSIGTGLVHELVEATGEVPYMVDNDDSRLFALEREVTGDALQRSDRVILADVRDASRVDRVIRELDADIVVNAAALKHVTLNEKFPCEAIKTIVFGTLNLVESAARAGVERFVNISTDKAADPTSILGGAKLIGEAIVRDGAGSMRTCSVRFGNVAGSRGSLLEILADAIPRGLPVCVTHPEATRYMMSVRQAARLVLDASAMADRGEVYVLDMGDPIRIIDLVHRFAEILGVTPDKLDVEFTGLRPGEKLHEVLFAEGEHPAPTSHRRIAVTLPHVDVPRLTDLLDPLHQAIAEENDARARQELFALVDAHRRTAVAA